MIDSIVGHDPKESNVNVIGVPYEHTASFGTGADKAPSAIKEVLDANLELFDRYSKTEPAYDYKFGYYDIENVSDLSPSEMVDQVAEALAQEDGFYVLLGGVHSVSIPSFKSLAKKVNPSEVTVVQIDAHFDLRDDDSEYNDMDPSPFAHSTAMRRAHEYGFTLLPIGVRTMFKGEYEFAKEHNITYFEWGRYDIKTPSIGDVIAAIPTDKVYLTIDVDGFDPSVMPATGTPVSGGLSWEYGEALIRELMKQKEVIAADVVEVAPNELSGQTEYNAAQLVYHLLALHGEKYLKKD